MIINMRSVIKFSVLFLLIASLFSCCVIEELEFDKTTLPDAVLNQEYNVTITASVKNNPDDDSFDYDFILIGSLPDGLFFTKDLNNRRVIISGTPTSQGTYILTLKGKVSDPYDLDDENNDLLDITLGIEDEIVCSNHYEHEQTYTLNVNVM